MSRPWEDTIIEILEGLSSDATAEEIDEEIGRRLRVLGRRDLASLAHALLDVAERLVDLDQAELAQHIARAVKKSVRIAAQRWGDLGAYSEPVVDRGRAFLAFAQGRAR